MLVSMCVANAIAAGVPLAPSSFSLAVKNSPSQCSLVRRVLGPAEFAVGLRAHGPAGGACGAEGAIRLRGGGRKKEESSEEESDGVIGSKVGKSPKKTTPMAKGKKKVESEESDGSEQEVSGGSEEDDDNDEGDNVSNLFSVSFCLDHGRAHFYDYSSFRAQFRERRALSMRGKLSGGPCVRAYVMNDMNVMCVSWHRTLVVLAVVFRTDLIRKMRPQAPNQRER
jgi:hypothetical protein